MGEMEYRFIMIFMGVVTGLVLIPIGMIIYWVKKYKNTVWWMLPVVTLYMFLFFSYSQDLIPEKWKLKPVETYQCEWKTTYIPKYP